MKRKPCSKVNPPPKWPSGIHLFECGRAVNLRASACIRVKVGNVVLWMCRACAQDLLAQVKRELKH